MVFFKTGKVLSEKYFLKKYFFKKYFIKKYYFSKILIWKYTFLQKNFTIPDNQNNSKLWSKTDIKATTDR